METRNKQWQRVKREFKDSKLNDHGSDSGIVNNLVSTMTQGDILARNQVK